MTESHPCAEYNSARFQNLSPVWESVPCPWQPSDRIVPHFISFPDGEL
ncbi:MAG: hypothetical protein IJQ81_17530 [Oscillibacter sp.]|nr:hypothetical protein [Oscillibacter sp.]